jgi:hypothetical protein
MADNPFEIPRQMRDLAEQNIKQAHAAYEQLTDFVTKATDARMGAMPASPTATGFKEVQDRAAEIAMENAESVFTFAGKISNVRTPQDIATLQTQFVQDRIQAFVTQMLELQQLIFPEAPTRLIYKKSRARGGRRGFKFMRRFHWSFPQTRTSPQQARA